MTRISLKKSHSPYIKLYGVVVLSGVLVKIFLNSKHILDNINKEVIKATKVNLWKNTPNVIEWFQTIPDKAQHAEPRRRRQEFLLYCLI